MKAEFLTNASRLCRDFRSFMGKYGANAAGAVWISGSVVQFLLGAVATSPREIASSLFNLASPVAYFARGHKSYGVTSGAALGIIGTELAVHPGLVNGEPGTIFGFAVFVTAAIMGVFNASLTRRFAVAKNVFLRVTLGNPRRSMGLTIFTLSRLPIIYEGLAHGRDLSYIAPFIIWGMGDLVCGMSRPEMTTSSPRPALQPKG